MAGVPVTGKSFYMPFFGISENITGWKWLQDRKFPIPVSFNFGLVRLLGEYLVPVSTKSGGK